MLFEATIDTLSWVGRLAPSRRGSVLGVLLLLLHPGGILGHLQAGKAGGRQYYYRLFLHHE